MLVRGTLVLAFGTAFVACKSTNHVSQPKVDISVGQADEDQIKAFVAKLKPMVDSGSGTLAGDDVFGFFPMSDDERGQLNASRPDPANVSCTDSICTIDSPGSELYVTMSQVSVPGLGAPQLWLGKKASLKVRINADNDIEICRTTDIQVKKGLWVNFKGAHVQPSGTTLDIGPGGSYPNC